MSADARQEPVGSALAWLSLGALGVVYGDIGTSPLYALTECFRGVHSVEPTPENIVSVLSLVVWALMFVVTFKYLLFVMRADNRGEGGILALFALVRPRDGTRHRAWLIIGLGLFGAALLYGDGVITPAITVLGAVEGLSVATPAFQHLIVPVSVGILVLLFWFGEQLLAGLPQLSQMDPSVTGGVAVWAHVGGFLAGLVLIRLFAKPVAPRPQFASW